MRILFEQHQYPYKDVAGDVWDGVSADPDGYVTFDYVGYFYNEKNAHCVLILPRVLLEDVTIDGKKEERVFVEKDKDGKLTFEGFSPEKIIDPEAKKPDGTPLLSKEQRRFIREFAVWIYRAIDLYWKNICKDTSEEGKQKRRAIYRKFVPVMGRGSLRKSHTLLDVILAMREFQKENEHFFIRVLRERTSGQNKINWSRTVARSPMMLTGAGPLYSQPYNRRHEINWDEELFTIFYSVLAYCHDEFGFEKVSNPGFAILKPMQFKHYMGGMGIVRLRQIRHKYFSDQALRMWDLCYSFFEHQHEIRVSGTHQEFLLAKDFQIVFEAMIDELIGDKNIPDGLKEQADGKRVDHMYRYHPLEEADDEKDEERKIYYIGDSKYYKRRDPIGDHSVYKQFTYARNVIQWNLDLFLDDKVPSGVEIYKGIRRLRNETTEGYAVIPNFFISARIDDDLRYDHREIVPTSKPKKDFFARQFENRLFDRDTFLIAHYDVNFLYVLSLYAKNNVAKRQAWQSYVREEFRKRIRVLLEENFKFFVMTPKSDTNAAAFFKEHFQDVVGKVYDPYGTRGGFEYYSLALRNGPEYKKENDAAEALLKEGFKVEPLMHLGQKPEDVVHGEAHNPNLVMSGYNFERAAKELSKGSYSVAYDMPSIKAIRAANAFPCEKGIGIKDHPENVHTVFLFESGGDNILRAVLQVEYLDALPSRQALLAYKCDGLNCAKLATAKYGIDGTQWLWRIAKWVDV